ncbi:hypothetical protein [Microvirga sp. KLBC 81]|uniref:hypothetical protein n=1 Tax=Microvirga sp. KLBC 81 TaxID=1862707 RepID=UPI00105782B1|nr:hypothetical protein [Microvirga sp. KLBC 81]
MTSAALTTSLPDDLEPDLAKALAYWKDLLRGENPMPFSDDVDLSQLPELSSNLMLLTAFENPDRFRFETAGEKIVQESRVPLAGEFSDEIPQNAPLEGFTEQCLMTVSQRAPTYFRSPSGSYARLVLPTWGEGHVLLLLAAVAKTS